MASNLIDYNLKAVIHETGLTPATLRAWERFYDLLKPKWSPGRHRLYTQDEIERLNPGATFAFLDWKKGVSL